MRTILPLLILVALVLLFLLAWLWAAFIDAVDVEESAARATAAELTVRRDELSVDEIRTPSDQEQKAEEREAVAEESDASFAAILDRQIAELLADSDRSSVSMGGKYGGRWGGRKRLRGKKRKTSAAIALGLEWLAAHQSKDGRWDCDGFMRMDESGVPCDGGGSPAYDVGVTALALLTFLGDGQSVWRGPHANSLRRGVIWLESQQGEDGRIGLTSHQDYIYGHAMATYALCEAYGMSYLDVLKEPAQRAIDYLEAHRNPQIAWGYGPAAANSDVSVTTWAVMAYRSARDFRMKVAKDSRSTTLAFLDEVTEPETGRAGYSRRGEPASRRGANGLLFPPSKTESLAALGLFSRFLLGQSHSKLPIMIRAAKTIGERPIEWSVGSGTIDCYYWWFATQALYQAGRGYWGKWSKGLDEIVRAQRTDANYAGSWDPVGVWGSAGGRVATTALLVLTLESYYRLTRLVR